MVSSLRYGYLREATATFVDGICPTDQSTDSLTSTAGAGTTACVCYSRPVNPAFLAALNHLNHLGVMLFDKHNGVTFRLQHGTTRDVVSTRLFIDGQTLEYFNQIPFWQTVQWPGETYKPGSSLKWNSLSAGARLYCDLPGHGALSGCWRSQALRRWGITATVLPGTHRMVCR